MLKFLKVKDIVLKGTKGLPMPGLYEGYRAGVFTIHKFEYENYLWVLSCNGIKLMHAYYLENAKKAAREFDASGVDWNMDHKILGKMFGKDKALGRKMIDIRTKYQAVGKIYP